MNIALMTIIGIVVDALMVARMENLVAAMPKKKRCASLSEAVPEFKG